MKKSRPHVYIGIVTYNSAKHMRSCIPALLAQTYQPLTIIVYDNNSTDGIVQVVRKFGITVIFLQSRKNLGYGAGHNAILQSIEVKDTDFYMTLNPDAILSSGCIQALVDASKIHNADWVTGKLYKDHKKHLLYSVGHAMKHDGYAYNIGYGLRDVGQYDKPQEVFGAPGAAALYRGSMIRRLTFGNDFFDRKLFMYYEDVDIDWRAQVSGLRCWYEPGAVIIHPGGIFPAHLEAHVLVNRFLSVLKNAFITDLLFYNMPIMLLHILGRLILTPWVGMQMGVGFISVIPYALQHRTQARASYIKMHDWFNKARHEQSSAPTTLSQRMDVFLHRKFYR